MVLARTLFFGRLLYKQLLLAGFLAVNAWAAAAPAVSSITSDGTLGTTVNQSGSIFNIGGGTRPGGGANLFQSFGLFTVAPGDTANFVNSSGLATSNIISRVTGGQVSNIYGTIQTTEFPGAHLFLINPAGVVFGPTATLNVSGSFHVSTANYLRFADGAKFYSSLGPTSTLTMATPTAFGFLGGSTPAPITVESSSLQVPEGQTLSLVGGDIQISGASLSAPSGRVQIASVASAGEVSLSNLDVSSFSQLGQISISANGDGTPSLIDASDVNGIGGGSVIIRGGQLLVNQSTLSANTALDVDGAPLAVDVQVTGDVLLSNGASFSASTISGAGRGGDIQVSAGGTVQLEGSSFIQTDTFFGDGKAGDISVTSGQLNLFEGSRINSFSLFGAGEGGNINVTADAVTISGRDGFSNESGIFTQTLFGTGAAGQLSVTAQTLSMSDGGTLNTTTFSEGAGGAIDVNVGSLTMTSGARIQSSTGFSAPGGNVTVNANAAVISGQDSFGPSGIFVSSIGDGPAGDISMNVATLNLSGGARIENGSPAFDPQGGNIFISATNSISISEQSGISSQASVQDAGVVSITTPSLAIDNGFISTSTLESGRAGDINLNVGSLTLTDGGQVTSSSDVVASGSGGNINVSATGPISISGSAPGGVPPNPFGSEIRSGLFSTASAFGTGDGGQIVVNAPKLNLSDGAAISVTTAGVGNAGSISLDMGSMTLKSGARVESSTSGAGLGGSTTVNATDSVAISGSSSSGASGIYSTASGDGPGGQISITAPSVQIANGGTISTQSTGSETALAGDISIVTKQLDMNNATITTEALVADGGSISITATGSLINMVNSQITTSVQSGVGSGGNITIGAADHPFDYLLLNNSGIHANAFGGPGGNISIFADVFLSSTPISTAVTASSALSTPGVIDIQASITDINGNLPELPEAPLQAATLLRASCAVRLAEGKSSSLVLAGRDGLPYEPGGLLPSPMFGVADPAGRSAMGQGRGAASGLFQSPSWFGGSTGLTSQHGLGLEQFQLAKAVLGLGCSR